MKGHGLILLGALALASTLQAQVGREYFTTEPDSALDAEHAPQQAAFLVLRDSTSAISAAGAKLMSDLTPTSSLAWMQSRARAVAAACARAVGPLAGAQAVTDSAVWARTTSQQAQAALRKEIASFAGTLADCQARWKALAADTSQVSLRENSPYQMRLLQNKINTFDRAAQHYLRSIDVKLPPKGVPTP